MIWGGIWLLIAVSAMLMSWRTPMRIVGAALAASSASTTTVYMTTPFPVHVAHETLVAWIIGLVSAGAWAICPRRPYAMIIILAFADVAFAASICLMHSESDQVKTYFPFVTNAIFALQCLCVVSPGVQRMRVANVVRDRLRAFYGRHMVAGRNHGDHLLVRVRGRAGPGDPR